MAGGPIIVKPAKLDLEVPEGSSFERILVFEETENFTPSDYMFRGKIKRSFRDRLPLAAFSFDDLGEGSIRMWLTPQESTKLTAGTLLYDVEMYSQTDGVDDYVGRILQGKMRVSAEVTT